jgi:general secretion pathway protein M
MKFETIAFRRSGLARRAIFIGANAVFFSLVYAGLIAPIQGLIAGGADAVTERQAALARYEVVAGQEDAVREYVRQVKDSNARGELFEGASEGIVNANLQARLKASAENAGTSVRSIQALPVKTIRGAALIGARIEVSGTLKAVHTLVRAIEHETPLLVIASATMRQQVVFWQSGDKGHEGIEAQFDVYGGASPKEHS